MAVATIPLAPTGAGEVDPRRLPPVATKAVDFRGDVLPILEAHCFKCHQGDDASSGARLDRRAEVLGEGDGEPLAVVGRSAESRLIHLVSGVLHGEVMPPKGRRLTAAQVGLLRAWIDQGLTWDDAPGDAGSSPSTHWAFQPVTVPAVPRVRDAGWVRNPIDAFIAARQESAGVTPGSEAARRTWIRRLTFDLTGLPPTPEEIEAFQADAAPDASERLVERLLASPRYGQRWGRHWLDLARWAESEGYESNHPRPSAWRYRDYVVRSFNADTPFDRFLRAQLAGDEILPYSDENLIATGFPPEMRRALETASDRRSPAEETLARQADLALQFTAEEIEKAIRDEDRALYAELKKKLAALEKRMPDRPQTFGFYSPATSPTPVDVLPMKGFYPLPYEPAELSRARPYVLVGGDVHNRGPALDAGWPAVFGPTPEGVSAKASRLALADWLTDPRHPLTARVWVNRLWAYHFGRGIVATPSDFGLRGAPPTHPELLDWLAGELVRSGWSTKHIHRLIVNSSTYRQSAEPSTAHAAIDPDNTLWWRWSPRRLEAEVIRDAMLAVSGELDEATGGPGLPDDDSTVRRSLYLSQKRDRPPAMQALFDGPSAVAESCPRRYVSTVPLQALHQLNS